MADLREELESAYATTSNESNPPPVPSTPEPAPAPVASPVDTGAETVAQPSGDADKTQPPKVEAVPGEAATSKSTTPTVEQVAGTEAKSGVPEDKKTHTDTNTDEPGPASAVKPPASWKKEAKETWATLPPAAQKEILRREREIQQRLTEDNVNRQRIDSLAKVLEPHRERIASVHGGNPLQAIQRMLHVEQTMFGGSPAQKAKLIANMVKEFRVDIEALDNELAGTVTPEARQQTEMERILEQKLAPMQQYVQSLQQQEQIRRQQEAQDAQMTVQQMAEDSDTYPHFEAVREDMADMIEFYAKKGLALPLPEAYSKVVRMLDLEPARQQGTSTQAALEAHRAAQAAKGASVSVSGAPVSTGTNHGNPKDLRNLIASAFDGGDRI